ncbi:MAG: hypothetical protein AAB789_00095 [Patescibacteria group bacterium]
MQQRNIRKKILNYLLIGGGLFLILSSPIGARRFLKQLPKELKKYKKSQIRQALYRLQSRNNIEYIKEEKDTISVKITEEGRKYLKHFKFDNLFLNRPKVWDKKWRMVIFDIPEKKKLAREALRGKLKDLGFVKLQDSIWVTPFPCENEIKLIKLVFNLSDFWLDVILTDDLGLKDYQFRKLFDLV